MSITENELSAIRDCIQQLKDCATFLTKSVEDVENEIKDLTITTPTATDEKEHTKEYEKIRKVLKKVYKECKQKVQLAAKSIKDSEDNNLEASLIADDDTTEDQASKVEDQASRVEDQASGVVDQASGVEDQASGVEDQASGVEDQASEVEDQARGVDDQASIVENQANRLDEQEDRVEDQAASETVPVASSETEKEINMDTPITVNGENVNGHEIPKENGKVTPEPVTIVEAEKNQKSSESKTPPNDDANLSSEKTIPSAYETNQQAADIKPAVVDPPVEEVKNRIRLVAIEKLLDPKVFASSSANRMPFRPRPLSPAYISPNIPMNTSGSIIILDSDDDDVPVQAPVANQSRSNNLNGNRSSNSVSKTVTSSVPITNGEKGGPTSQSTPKVMPLKIRISRCKISESLVKAGKRVIKLSKVPSARAASPDSSEDSARRSKKRRRYKESEDSSASSDSDFEMKSRKRGKYEKDSEWTAGESVSKSSSHRSRRRREDRDRNRNRDRRRSKDRSRESRRHKESRSSKHKRSHSTRHISKIIDSDTESDKNSNKENNSDIDDIEAQLQQMESSANKGEKSSRKDKSSKSSRREDKEKSKSRKEKTSKKSDDGSSSDEDISEIKEKVADKSSKEGETGEDKSKANSEKNADDGNEKEKDNTDANSQKDKDNSKSESSSDEEVVKVRKNRSTRKRRIRTSSASASDDKDASEDAESSDDDDDDSDDKSKKKGKPGKKKNNKGDDSGSDSDGPVKRKNIRKILKTTKLDESTIKATEAEKERRKRIEERQKLYNQIFEKPESTEIDKVVLDFDPETKKELLTVDKGLLKKLKPHQVEGVKFMWDACFETIKDIETKPGSGCILGHCMGLGKTLQIVTLSHTLLANHRKTNVNTVLVITPLSTVTNWAKEFHMWIKFCKYKDIEVYDMSKYKDKKLRAYKLSEWQEDGGVCILGYDMYRILSNPKVAGGKRMREQLQKALVDPGPDMIVCDEGHLLKNEKTSISKAVNQVRTLRRIVLSGTPLQNNLKEYYCMVQFVKPNLLGTYKEYLNRFVNPITNGQYTDSTERDIRLMKNRSHILHKMLEGCIQRRDYSVLAPYLPPKHEYVVFIALSELQVKLYEYYMANERSVEPSSGAGGKGTTLFKDFQNLRRVWTHPMALRVNSDEVKKKKERKAMLEDDSMDEFINDGETTESESSASSSDSDDSGSTTKRKKGKNKADNSSRRTRNNPNAEQPEIIEDEEEQPCASEWWKSLCNESDLKNLHHSPKLYLLFEILQECETIGDKLLLFSQSLQSLDVIESFLSLIDRKTQGIEKDCDVNGFIGSWKQGQDYFRLDGSNTVESREQMCRRFNNPKDIRSRLFLISTRAGSLGINLVAANRVIIFDASWNPSHDTQSIFRVYRFGQEKPCYIYRFIAKGTMEEKIYERQVMKQATAKRVIDEHQIGRHYNSNDLMELYQFDLSVPEVREVPILPKDRLFAELIKKHEKFIIKYHEHDSLLENKESENLNEEERKAAWAEFETEKNQPATSQYTTYAKPNYRNGPVTSSKIFGFRSDVLLRLLNLKVRREHPHLTDMEVGQFVPLYLRQLYEQMNSGVLTLFTELNEMNRAFEMPTGYGMNPMNPNYIVNPFYQPPAQQNTEPAYIHEID